MSDLIPKFDLNADSHQLTEFTKYQTKVAKVSLEETSQKIHQHAHELLKAQEQKYHEEIVKFLSQKEKEMRAVIDELSYRSTLDSTKDILIKRLTAAISKIEQEGCEVLAHVVKQNEKIKCLKD